MPTFDRNPLSYTHQKGVKTFSTSSFNQLQHIFGYQSSTFEVKHLKEFEYVDWLNIAKKIRTTNNKNPNHALDCKRATPVNQKNILTL